MRRTPLLTSLLTEAPIPIPRLNTLQSKLERVGDSIMSVLYPRYQAVLREATRKRGDSSGYDIGDEKDVAYFVSAMLDSTTMQKLVMIHREQLPDAILSSQPFNGDSWAVRTDLFTLAANADMSSTMSIGYSTILKLVEYRDQIMRQVNGGAGYGLTIHSTDADHLLNIQVAIDVAMLMAYEIVDTGNKQSALRIWKKQFIPDLLAGIVHELTHYYQIQRNKLSREVKKHQKPDYAAFQTALGLGEGFWEVYLSNRMEIGAHARHAVRFWMLKHNGHLLQSEVDKLLNDLKRGKYDPDIDPFNVYLSGEYIPKNHQAVKEFLKQVYQIIDTEYRGKALRDNQPQQPLF